MTAGSADSRISLLAGGGELGALIRGYDWARHPLGPPDRWPRSLQIIIRVMLDSRYAMWLGWGDDFTFFYNDAYATMTLGPKHPWALGRPAREVWSEIWADIGPRAESVIRTREATWDEGLQLFLERRGFPEETYHTFSYSPVPDDEGGVGGMLCVVTEDTDRTIGERRVRTLRDLAAAPDHEVRSVEQACRNAARILEDNPFDVPFALLYLLDDEGRQATLAGSAGVEPDSPAAPLAIRLDDPRAIWPLARVHHTGQLLDELAVPRRLAPLRGPVWPDPITRVTILPMARPGVTQVAGFIVAGVSPRRPLDDGYRGFFSLLAGQIATAVANARAYHEEQRRMEALAELDRAKTMFFSNVSHEFRTPLTLMLGPIEDLLARPAAEMDGEDRRSLEVIHRNGLRLLKLVNTLLDFSRIEAGRAHATFRPTDIAAATRELASVFRSAIERGGLELVVDCPPVGPVWLDHDMWEKIVLNLLSNAFKFTFEGRIEVRLRPAGAAIELAVSDTGVGIPARDIPFVFDRFRRVEGTRRRTHEGTGIGLALVHELVRLHGGSVAVESIEGGGTTFTVTVPTGTAHLAPDQVDPSPPPAISTSPRLFTEEALRWLPTELDGLVTSDTFRVPDGESGSPGAHRPRILLADDNGDMREYVARLLGTRFDVVAVADGRSALDAALAEPPDLILADVMMPGLDGFGLLAAIREDSRFDHVPVILLSARAGEEARVEGMSSGAADYLVKPFSGRELVTRVSAHLEIARLRRDAELRQRELRQEAETLNEVARAITAELDLDALIQRVTDAGTSLTGAAFGAFFHNEVNEQGDGYLLYTLSGAPREAFERFGTPRNTALFDTTFRGAGPVRIDDVLADPRYGGSPPHDGLPAGQLGVRSYLAVPVVSRTGEVHGGLFFGHPEVAVFTERAERLALGIAAQAAIAIDNARLYRRAQQDLAERHRAEEALRQRTLQYETLLSQAPLGVYLVDADFRIREVNPTALALLGAAPDLIGSDFGEVAHRLWSREYADDLIGILRNTLETGEPHVASERVEDRLDRDLTEYYEWRADRIPLPDGRWGVVCYFRDISTQVVARLALARSERQFRAIVDALPAAVYTTDASGALTHFNALCTELAGRQPSLGDPWCVGWKLYRSDGRPLPHDECPMAASVREGRIVRDQEIIVERPDGTRRWVMPYPTPLFDEAGRLVGGVNMLVDITARKEAEQAIRESEATVQRALESERSARSDAEQASRIKDEFLATLSHELRTPLNAILGWSRLIERTPGEVATVRQGIEVITRNTRIQSDLIADLLDMSAIISGKIRLAIEPVYLSDVVTAAVDAVRPAADAKGVRIQAMVSPISDPVRGDPSRLQQVVWNLLSNAVKFTPKEGRVQVTVSKVASSAEIVVSDTGAGIRPEFLPHIFERFRQADSSIARQHGGLGLGLSIVKQLVELHGGAVRAASAGETKGATFTVQLPLALTRIGLGEGEPTPTDPGTEFELRGIRVLAVDDQPDARDLLRRLLEERSAEVVTAASADEALVELERHHPHVVLCDIGMPGKDGYEFIRSLRLRGDETPAVAVTAFARSEDRLRALRAGYQGHVSKPLEPAELIATVAVFTKGPLRRE